MDLTVESSPSNRKTQSNKLAVFSSIENRSDILEGRKSALHDEMSSDNKNIRTYNMETKRYAVPQNLKDNFYAIHHIQKSIKENERLMQQSENAVPPSTENSEPVQDEQTPKPTGSKKPMTTTTIVRGRKRITPELIHKPLAPTVDQNSPPSSQNENVKRKKVRQQNSKTQRKSTTVSAATSAAELPSLYQTCVRVWPEEHSLGDYSHDNIKSLSNLLKIRLCQAKFKMMATLDQDNELFSFLAEEYVSPKPRSPHTIKFSGKQSKSSLSIVGNGKNLFNRNQTNQYRYDVSSPTSVTKDDYCSKQPHTPKDTTVTSPQRTPQSKPKERKKKTPRNNATKTPKKTTTPKRKSAAADVTPIVQSDGSSVYVCIPCDKKYKNRNGLAYHLERCKYTVNKQDEKEEEQTSQNGDNIISCICTQNTDEHGTMVQCDKCRIWLHSECVGLTEENADDVFHCQTCKDNNNTNISPNDLLQSLLDAQQSPSDREEVLSQNIQDIFSQTTRNEDTQSDDDFPMEEDDSEVNNEIPSSNQLHVWDDFSFTEQLDRNNNNNNNKSNEPWSMLDEDEPFSSYDNDIPSSSWTMNDINIFSQPPSLLFSEATLNSTLDDDINSMPLIGDLSTEQQSTLPETTPLNESTPNCATPCDTPNVVSNTNTPVHTADGLWFQFANFDDDYQCET